MWITQILLAWDIAVWVYAIVRAMMQPHPHVSDGALALRLLELFGPIPLALAILFYGVMRARRWSWFGSVLHAAVTLVLYVFATFITPFREVHYASQVQQAVALSIEIVWSCLLAFYLLTLFLSPKVRNFFGVDGPKGG